MIGLERKGVLKVLAGGFRLSAAGFENAEVVPAVGVAVEELQGLLLLGNRILQIAVPCKHLRQR